MGAKNHKCPAHCCQCLGCGRNEIRYMEPAEPPGVDPSEYRWDGTAWVHKEPQTGWQLIESGAVVPQPLVGIAPPLQTIVTEESPIHEGMPGEVRAGDWVILRWKGRTLSEGKVTFVRRSPGNDDLVTWRDEAHKREHCSMIPPSLGMEILVRRADGIRLAYRGPDSAPARTATRRIACDRHLSFSCTECPPGERRRARREDAEVERRDQEDKTARENLIKSYGEAGWNSNFFIGQAYEVPKGSQDQYRQWLDERDTWTVSGDEKAKERMLSHVGFDCPPEAGEIRYCMSADAARAVSASVSRRQARRSVGVIVLFLMILIAVLSVLSVLNDIGILA